MILVIVLLSKDLDPLLKTANIYPPEMLYEQSRRVLEWGFGTTTRRTFLIFNLYSYFRTKYVRYEEKVNRKL